MGRAPGLPARKKTGFPIVISGPSGAGKTSLCKRLMRGDGDFYYSVSATTRPRRRGEREGRDYVFLTRREFERLRKRRGFIEWAEVHGELYGTPRKPVEENLRRGKIVILDVDVQGGVNLRKVFKDGVFVFVAPPSERVLKERLSKRGTETPKALAKRLKDAADELRQLNRYSYLIINDDLNDAAKELKSIVTAERCRISRYAVSGGVPA